MRRSRTRILAAAVLSSAAFAAGASVESGWYTALVDWNRSPVDLSFLNAPERPAGKRGFVAARGEDLVFEDGTRARFWGTNLTANALFSARKENVQRHARRLSELGFNLVRLHHHDSPWVSPNIFGGASPDTREPERAMLERLDWWIKCLKEEGIYVWLDLHVERNLKPGDQIRAFDEISKGKPAASLKGYNYVNPEIGAAMKRFNAAYVNHRNIYTGIAYKDEPAIVAMLLTNENDVTNKFGNALLPDKNVPWHTAAYMAEAESFARKHGLAADRTWRSWEHGPSKLFLNDLERRFNADMLAHLRAQRVRVPVATTNTWGRNPLSSLPALSVGELVDVHSYGEGAELEANPLRSSNLVHWIAAAQVAGKPLSVTEWNVLGFPAPDRHSVPLLVAAAASHQGWDALMQYAYAQTPLDSAARPSNWHAFNDPALLASLPAAALLYRRADVREATRVYAFAPDPDQLFDERISPENSPALRTAAEIGKLVIALPAVGALPWLQPSGIPAGAVVISDPQRSLIAADAAEAVSDTGELRRNWEHGTYRISTPRTQAALGRIGGRRIELPDVDISVTTPNASVAVQSMTEHAIRASGAILVSLGARSIPKSRTELPYYSEPVEGKLSVRAPAGLRLYAASAGSGARELPLRYEEGWYRITLDSSMASYWLVLR